MWLHNASKWLVEEIDKESGHKLFSHEFNDYNEALYEFNQRNGNQNSTVNLTKSQKKLLTE